MKKLLLLVVPLLAIGFYLYTELNQSALEAVPIRAEIELINECDVPSSYFAIKVMGSGRTYSLAKGRTSVDAIKGEKMQLVLSPSVKEVEYDGTIFKAAAFQRITADCSFGERQRGVTDGLKSTFSGSN